MNSDDERVQHMLNDLRNTLLGVQVLLAGMISVAFAPAFAALPAIDRYAYGTAVLGAAAASCFLIAPTQYHRVARHHYATQSTLRLGRWCGNVGSAFLATAVTAVVFVISDVVFGGAFAVVAASTVAATAVALWFVLPLTVRRSGDGDTATD